MRSVEFVDTSVLLNILAVPGWDQDREAILASLESKMVEKVQLIIPIATVIETGNRIAQLGDGNVRRRCAERFVDVLRSVASGNHPWILYEVGWDCAMLNTLCDGVGTGVSGTGSFVELAMRGDLGTGDLSILAERDRYLARTLVTSARVWTLDRGLERYAA